MIVTEMYCSFIVTPVLFILTFNLVDIRFISEVKSLRKVIDVGSGDMSFYGLKDYCDSNNVAAVSFDQVDILHQSVTWSASINFLL